MHKLISATIALSIVLLFTGCSTSNQTAQQRQACAAGDPQPWCPQVAQTKPDGSNGSANPDGNPPYPTNPGIAALSVTRIPASTFNGLNGINLGNFR